jgi:predicted methyltransferase/DNA-directed RNA polymerase subunit RPC12/RpoP
VTPDEIVGEVAAAVGLAEGEAGVGSVVRAVGRLEPVAIRSLSRATELPVPFVSAICNELRKRGVVDAQRPVRLTVLGRRLFEASALRLPLEATCPTCAGRETVLPSSLAPAVRELAAIAEAAPPARVELDQSHCTVETKLRRVLALYEAGALADRRLVLLGDDDLTSVAVRLVVEHLGASRTVRRLTVVDVDPGLVSFLSDALRGAPFEFECVEHDLRDRLPERLVGSADTVFTDPPYTSAGAALFLARAVEATGGRAGRDVFAAFGPTRPETALEVQRAIAELGLVVRGLVRNFNEYLGAGVLGGTSHLYHLRTTSTARPLVARRHTGPLYTGDFRVAARSYRCKRCGTRLRVGRGLRWTTVAALKRDRCPRCAGDRFLPLASGP